MGYLWACAGGTVLIWFFAVYAYQQNRSFNRLFVLLLMTIIVYLSLAITIFASFELSLPFILCMGALPVLVVAYGYRYYEHRYQMNDDPDALPRDEINHE